MPSHFYLTTDKCTTWYVCMKRCLVALNWSEEWKEIKVRHFFVVY